MSYTDTLASNMAANLCNRLHGTGNGDLCNHLHGPVDDQVAFYAGAARSSATRRAYAPDMAAFSTWVGGSLARRRQGRPTLRLPAGGLDATAPPFASA